jgi:hypothetical protein
LIAATSADITVAQISMLEVAVEAPCFNNNQWQLQKRLFSCLRLSWVAIGCILVVQAVQIPTTRKKRTKTQTG